MNLEQMVGVAVRLFAVFLVAYTLRYATSLIAFAMVEPPDYINSTFILLFGFSPILIAIILWRFPLTVASKLIPKVTTGEKPKSPLSGPEIQVVAFSVLGLWLLASAIPDILYWIAYVYRIKSVSISFRNVELTPQNIGGMVSASAEFILGLWLLLGSKSIVGIVRRLRHADH